MTSSTLSSAHGGDHRHHWCRHGDARHDGRLRRCPVAAETACPWVIVCRKIRAAALLGAWLLGVRTEGVDWDMHPPPLPEKLKGASHPPEARPGLSGSARAHVGLFLERKFPGEKRA